MKADTQTRQYALRAIRKTERIEKWLKAKIVGHDGTIDMLLHTFLAQHHSLLVSEPGTAKSLIARLLSSCIRPIYRDNGKKKRFRFFSIQMEQGVLPEEVFGPVSLRALQKRDEVVRKIKGFLPSAHFAFIDEIFDAPPGLLRGMLQILNERRFERGAQSISVPLRAAITTTNFAPDDSRLDAVIDRFLFRTTLSSIVPAISRPVPSTLEEMAVSDEVKDLVSSYSEMGRGENMRPPCRISLEEWDAVARLLRYVTIPGDAITCFSYLLSDLRAKGIAFSDRRACWTLDLARLMALRDRRLYLTTKDIISSAPVLLSLEQARELDKLQSSLSSVLKLSDLLSKKESLSVPGRVRKIWRLIYSSSASSDSILKEIQDILLKVGESAPERSSLLAARLVLKERESRRSSSVFENDSSITIPDILNTSLGGQ